MAEESLKSCLLAFSDDILDASMKPLIEKWVEPPTSLQVLEVLDHCIYAVLASSFIISCLQVFYNSRLKEEGRTHEQNIPDAIWRKGR